MRETVFAFGQITQAVGYDNRRGALGDNVRGDVVIGVITGRRQITRRREGIGGNQQHAAVERPAADEPGHLGHPGFDRRGGATAAAHEGPVLGSGGEHQDIVVVADGGVGNPGRAGRSVEVEGVRLGLSCTEIAGLLPPGHLRGMSYCWLELSHKYGLSGGKTAPTGPSMYSK